MPVNSRGLVPPAIITSTIILVMCAVGWGALGVLSFAGEPDALSTAAHRYLSILVATATICSLMVNLFARAIRAVRAAPATDGGYATGYADGVDARPEAPVSPGVSRLMRSPR
jgi:hypothetical protein